jgi:ATP-binding cassette subfamily C protein CydCD
VYTGNVESAYLPLLALVSMAAFLPVAEIADVGRELANTLGSTQRLKAVYNEEVVITDGDQEIMMLKPNLDHRGIGINFNQVTFAYANTNVSALDGVSFKIAAGKTVALVGPSGAGKSTIAQLLMRFWDPQSGSVSMEGVDLREYKLRQLRITTALVQQDTYLFNDTLLGNLMIAKPNATTEQINQALSLASLTEFVNALPDGLQTYVGERGFSLSGGQRQRVAIARAFLKDSPILILDEATSHLDSVSEQIIHKALSQLMSNRTTLIIAHRLSTIKNADLILVLNHGKIVETGTHQELISRKGLYADLVSHQMSAGVS